MAKKTVVIKKDNKDFKFIRKFQKITIAGISKKLNIPRTAISQGSTTIENLHKVRKEIEKELLKIYQEEFEDELKTDSL